MHLFRKTEVEKLRKDQTRELVVKNERLATSLRKTLALQKEIDLDAEKAQKVHAYEVWCQDLQKKMSRELQTLEGYKTLVEERKDELYSLLAKKDALNDEIITKKEEIARLDMQINFKSALVTK